jgi:hypothetical protein
MPVDPDHVLHMSEDSPNVGHVRWIEGVNPHWCMGGFVHMLTLFIEGLRDGIVLFIGHDPVR